MPIQKFFIGPQDKGEISRWKSWLTPDRAFVNLRNLYTWRGSTKKRFGARPMNTTIDLAYQQQLTRLRVKLVTAADGLPIQTDVNGDLPATVIPGAASTWPTLGKMFSVGNCTYTVWQNGATKDTDDGTSVGLNAGSYNTATGEFTLTGGPAESDVYYYPAQPVMHFGDYNQVEVSDEEAVAFDQQFAYTFTYAGGWQRLVNTTVFPQANDTWTGSNSDFFWTTNYRGTAASTFLFFVTNNVPADAMRYWNGLNWNAFGTVGTTPINAGATIFIKTCAIIEPFQNRLLLFNVVETTVAGAVDNRYINRIWFSKIGDATAADSWRVDIRGLGGFVELPVMQAIVGVRFIKNRCIVFAEASTWELVFTGSPVLPFILQRINSELGVESRNSTVPFDEVVLGFGNVGIHECTGANVDRIDEDIPNTIFEVQNAEAGPQRVAGVRDYFNEMVYWSYPSIEGDTGANSIFPNRVLVYNYEEGTWAFNDDSITAFGNYQITQDLTWEQIESSWEELDIPWDDPSTQDRFKSVIAGNQQGWTFIINADWNKNSMALQITNLTYVGPIITMTIYNHNLAVDSYIYLQNIQGGTIGDVLNGLIFKVEATADVNTITITAASTPTGTYIGNGVVTLVSQIFAITKAYNFFYQQAAAMAINRVDFYVDKTSSGEVSIDYLVSSSDVPMVDSAEETGTLLGTAILSTAAYALMPLEANQQRFWHTFYPNFFGDNIQIVIYMSDAQMISGSSNTDPAVSHKAFEDFELNGMIFYVEPINTLGA